MCRGYRRILVVNDLILAVYLASLLTYVFPSRNINTKSDKETKIEKSGAGNRVTFDPRFSLLFSHTKSAVD